MELSIVISQMGLKGAQSHRSYERMVETWLDPNEPIPSLAECQAKWDELQASGYFEPPYFEKRKKAYIDAGLTMEKINEVTAEHAQALAAGDSSAVTKYAAQLAEIFEQRQAIKNQYPKP